MNARYGEVVQLFFGLRVWVWDGVAFGVACMRPGILDADAGREVMKIHADVTRATLIERIDECAVQVHVEFFGLITSAMC